MPQSVFHFKEFSIYQDRCAMKVGTDGVLLGSWAKAEGAERILDIGTGTGLLALMLAQKSTAQVDGIDIDAASCMQAIENVNASPWKSRMQIICTALQDFKPGIKYDVIISNPPYFIDSYLPDDEGRKRARQANGTLTYDELLQGSLRLLSAKGKLTVILPAREGIYFREQAMQQGLFNSRYTEVHSRITKPVKRLLMEFSREESETENHIFILHGEGREYSEEYKQLTAEFLPGNINLEPVQ